jgi:MinD-like ATPase involved in chromosome partitioning or flagellar assembly
MIISALLGSASGMTHELTSSDTLLRSPLALSRRIGFVQLRGGSGASATAGYVASMLARRRTGMVLAVNASAGKTNLLWQAGLTRSAARESSNLHRRAHPASAADARAGLPVTGTGLIALDLARDHLATSAGTWFEQVTPIARFYDLVITDWGVRHRQVDLRQVARASHVVCLVTRADRYPAEEAAALIPALSEVEDQPRVVLALVDVGRTAERTPQLLRDQLQVPVLTIPYDPLRASARPVSSRRLPTRTRLAYTRLCTALMAEAVRPDFRRLVAPGPQQSQPAPAAGGEQP